MLAFVPKPGDECLVVFADGCIDSWWADGGVQDQDDLRRHDLSDGFAVFAPWSQPNKPKLPDSGISMQSDDGNVRVHINGGNIAIKGENVAIESGSVSINSGSVAINSGSVNISGSGISLNGGRVDLNGAVYLNGVVLVSCTH